MGSNFTDKNYRLMKINEKLVKHYISYDITMLSESERIELAKEINNDNVECVLCNEIVK